MTPKQLFQELEDELKTVTWSGSSNKIFDNNVHVVTDIPMQALASFKSPTAFITDEGSQSYVFHDQLQEQQFSISIFVENIGDRYSSAMLEGGNRAASDSSRGAGFWDIETRLLEYLRTVTTLDSAKITLKSRSRFKTTNVKGANNPRAFRKINFNALVCYDTGTTPDHRQILRSPGRLFWNPSNAAGGSYGTLLGYLANGFLVDPGYQLEFLRIEDSGMTPKLCVYNGNFVQCVAEFLNYNADTIARCFLGMTSSTQINVPGSIKTGTLFSDNTYTSKLLFVPDDTTNNVAVQLFKAVPITNNFFRLARGEDTVFRCQFTALPDASNRLIYVGPIGNTPS